MRTTLLIKRIDLYLQITALIPILLGVLYDSYDIMGLTYFTLGGAQLTSCIMHRVLFNNFLRHKSRTAYEWVMMVLTILFIVGFSALYLFAFALFYLVLFLCFAGPLLAIWYLIISYIETLRISTYVDRKQYV